MEQLAQFLIHCKNCYAFSKFDVGKIKDELNIPLKSTAVFKKQRATRIILQLKELVQNIHDILTLFVIISLVDTNSLTTGVKFINPVNWGTWKHNAEAKTLWGGLVTQGVDVICNLLAVPPGNYC